MAKKGSMINGMVIDGMQVYCPMNVMMQFESEKDMVEVLSLTAANITISVDFNGLEKLVKETRDKRDGKKKEDSGVS